MKQLHDERKAEQKVQRDVCAAPMAAQARVKVAAEMMHVAALQLARECYFKPDDTARAIAQLWPDHNSDRASVRAMTASLVWDAQARGQLRRGAPAAAASATTFGNMIMTHPA